MDSYNFLPDNEVTEVEGRKYLNPNLVVDETNTFIDRLRNTQQANMQQTATQTQRLGTDVPSNLGGLTGAGSYWSSRYVTPQTSSAVSNLRAAAQAQALNQALANEQERWKQKYQDAYRAYQKSAYDKENDKKEDDGADEEGSTLEIDKIEPDALYQSRYVKILMKYIRAGYPVDEAEKKAKEDVGKSIDVDSPVDPYNGGN